MATRPLIRASWCFGETLVNAAWRTKPSWAVIATEGKAFGQRVLRRMASRIGGAVTEVAANHAVIMTQPRGRRRGD